MTHCHKIHSVAGLNTLWQDAVNTKNNDRYEGKLNQRQNTRSDVTLM